VGEALAAYRSLIALHPNAAVHHLQMASVLLDAGMGEAARAEARLAVKLDPNSALAERVLAYVLKHDLVGRNLRAGSDLTARPRPFARPSSWTPTTTNRKAIWPFCWSTTRWAGATAANQR
jgi:tetratricopeptide (TPR) repeat protein